jgi:hypothetical protein
MSKTKEIKIKTVDFEKAIMSKVKSNELIMKSHWYFVAGSVLTFIGFVTFTIVAVYLTNLMLFLLRKHGPMGQFRLEQILNSFPWWIPIFAIVGTIGGILFLRKYDFSYKKHFWLIIAGFFLSIILAAFLLDYFGLNDAWSRQGPMRGFYHQLQSQNNQFLKGQGAMHNGQGNGFYRQGQ